MRGRNWRIAVVALAALAVGPGCDRGTEGEAVPEQDPMLEARAGWPAELSARMDSGNAAYRAGRYDEAADVFRRATDQAPDEAAAWFGLHMAESARGNQAAADSALMRAEALTPGLGTGHPRMPAGDSPAGELPPGHPEIR